MRGPGVLTGHNLRHVPDAGCNPACTPARLLWDVDTSAPWVQFRGSFAPSTGAPSGLAHPTARQTVPLAVWYVLLALFMVWLAAVDFRCATVAPVASAAVAVVEPAPFETLFLVWALVGVRAGSSAGLSSRVICVCFSRLVRCSFLLRDILAGGRPESAFSSLPRQESSRRRRLFLHASLFHRKPGPHGTGRSGMHGAPQTRHNGRAGPSQVVGCSGGLDQSLSTCETAMPLRGTTEHENRVLALNHSGSGR